MRLRNARAIGASDAAPDRTVFDRPTQPTPGEAPTPERADQPLAEPRQRQRQRALPNALVSASMSALVILAAALAVSH